MDDAARRERIVALNDAGNAAFGAAELEEALATYRHAIALLSPDEDGWAPDLYENLGLCWFNLSRFEPAVVAFLRALDGDALRPQSAHYLPIALVGLGRLYEARRHLRRYEAAFGPHPTLTQDALGRLVEASREQRGRWGAS